MNIVVLIALVGGCLVGRPCELRAELVGEGGAPPEGTLALAVYEWEAAGAMATHTGGLMDGWTVTFWAPGTYTVTVGVASVWGEARGETAVEVGGWRVFLPLVGAETGDLVAGKRPQSGRE